MHPRVPTAKPVHIGVRVGLPVAIAVLVFVCFFPVLSNDFVNWDDPDTLLTNPDYRGLSPSHLRWMFTTFHMGHYQPVSWVTHAFAYLIWGMNPLGYHVVSLLIHAANAVLFYHLLLALLRRVEPGRHGTQGSGTLAAAAVGALFFALHPLRVEAVAWATDLHELLSTFFSLLTVLAYLRMEQHAAGRPRRWYALSVGCFALSVLSKATAMTLPAVLLVLDIYPLRRLRLGKDATRIPFLLEKLPYAVLAIGAGAVALLAKQDRGLFVLTNHGVGARVMQSLYGLCFYLWKTVAPAHLSPLYSLQVPLDPTEARFVVSGLGVLAITATVIALHRRCPWALASWAAYVVTVSPVLGLMQNGPQIAADRYSYFSCLPWAVLVAAAVHRVWHVWQARPWPVRLAAGTTVAAALGLLAFSTHAQTRVWRDSLTLWNRVLAIEPASPFAYANRGLARQEHGDLGGAFADYDQALRLNPAHVNAHIYYNRANARKASGDLDGAIADYTAAIRLNPQYASAYNNRGTTRHAKGEVDGALADLNEAVRLNPAYAKAYGNRGIARRARGDLAGALADFMRAVELTPATDPGRAPLERKIAALRQQLAH